MKHILFLISILMIGCNQQGETVSEYTDEQRMHHYMGTEMNMQTWNLLSKEDRNEQEDARMVYFAKASLYHWQLSPKFEPINEQRGQWMISHVFAVLGKGDLALEYAKKTLRLTEEHGFDDFDLAYAYEAMARAYAALGNSDDCKLWHAKATEFGKLIKGEEDKKYFEGDLASGPWFDIC